MKVEFINVNPNNTRLILIFTGWNSGPEIATDIIIDGWDTAVVHDFSDLRLDTSFLNNYYTIYLFSWSFGVYASNFLLPSDRITSAFAINGTLKPIDNDMGIPESIFEGTMKNLNLRNLKKFRVRMSGSIQNWEKIQYKFKDYQENEIENLKFQLNQIYLNYKNKKTENIKLDSELIPWVRAYIAIEDLIFPFSNQIMAWNENPDTTIIKTDGNHYLDLKSIIRGVIADTNLVSKKFDKAYLSYDTHAIAQYTAAIKLTHQLRDMRPAKNANILEIGCGTGLFTREYAQILSPLKATFVDIIKTGPFKIAPNEEYIHSDAEEWIEHTDEMWDIILSASCVQWFANLPRFFRKCASKLNQNGIIAISTFLPGNLKELDALRPSPLLYPNSTQLQEWLDPFFTDILIVEDEIKIDFKSIRDVLMHLKHTGVGGSMPSAAESPSKKLSNVRSLTYKPVYITARKK